MDEEITVDAYGFPESAEIRVPFYLIDAPPNILTPEEKLLWMAYARHWNRSSDLGWASMTTIRNKFGWGRNKAYRIKKSLEEKGWIYSRRLRWGDIPEKKRPKGKKPQDFATSNVTVFYHPSKRDQYLKDNGIIDDFVCPRFGDMQIGDLRSGDTNKKKQRKPTTQKKHTTHARVLPVEVSEYIEGEIAKLKRAGELKSEGGLRYRLIKLYEAGELVIPIPPDPPAKNDRCTALRQVDEWERECGQHRTKQMG